MKNTDFKIDKKKLFEKIKKMQPIDIAILVYGLETENINLENKIKELEEFKKNYKDEWEQIKLRIKISENEGTLKSE